jgi:hypothetical protein
MSMHPQWFVPKEYSDANEKAMVDTITDLAESWDKARKIAALVLKIAKSHCAKAEGTGDKEYLESFLNQVDCKEEWLTKAWEAYVIDQESNPEDSS